MLRVDEKIESLTQSQAQTLESHETEPSVRAQHAESLTRLEQEKTALEDRLESQRAEFELRARANSESLESANQTHAELLKSHEEKLAELSSIHETTEKLKAGHEASMASALEGHV